MKTYLYNDPVFDTAGKLINNTIVERTEQEILDLFWDRWYIRMVHKYGRKHKLITKENCISDWVAVYMAREKKDGN